MSRETPHIRPHDWPEKLAEWVEARRNKPFGWGSQDCVAMAADAVNTLVGIDPLAALRGTYEDEAGADAIIAADGNLYRLVCRLWQEAGFEPCAPGLAQRGDIAWVEHGNTQAMGVVVGLHVVVPGPEGLVFLPRDKMLRAWAT